MDGLRLAEQMLHKPTGIQEIGEITDKLIGHNSISCSVKNNKTTKKPKSGKYRAKTNYWCKQKHSTILVIRQIPVLNDMTNSKFKIQSNSLQTGIGHMKENRNMSY